MEKLLLRPEEAAEALGLGRTKLYSLIAAGEIESLTIGKRRLIPREAVSDFVERARSAATDGG